MLSVDCKFPHAFSGRLIGDGLRRSTDHDDRASSRTTGTRRTDRTAEIEGSMRPRPFDRDPLTCCWRRHHNWWHGRFDLDRTDSSLPTHSLSSIEIIQIFINIISDMRCTCKRSDTSASWTGRISLDKFQGGTVSHRWFATSHLERIMTDSTDIWDSFSTCDSYIQVPVFHTSSLVQLSTSSSVQGWRPGVVDGQVVERRNRRPTHAQPKPFRFRTGGKRQAEISIR